MSDYRQNSPPLKSLNKQFSFTSENFTSLNSEFSLSYFITLLYGNYDTIMNRFSLLYYSYSSFYISLKIDISFVK